MFTRYRGTEIPENYSGVRFRDISAHTEMKTHKPTPSYTSTKTSVSPMFRSAQLQRSQASLERGDTLHNDFERNEARHKERESRFFEQENEWQNRGAPQKKREDVYENGQFREEKEINEEQGAPRGENFEALPNLGDGRENTWEHENAWERENTWEHKNARDSEQRQERENVQNSNSPKNEDESKKAHKSSDFRSELSGLLDKVFKGIEGEDFLLLAVIFLILGEGKTESRGALLPLALLLLYS